MVRQLTDLASTSRQTGSLLKQKNGRLFFSLSAFSFDLWIISGCFFSLDFLDMLAKLAGVSHSCGDAKLWQDIHLEQDPDSNNA
jgi:hypothetical protein